MNRHRRFREMLARRIELTPADEQRLRAHLEGCPECRETAAAYEHQWKLLRSLPPLETPPTLRASVLNRIHAAPQPAVRWYRRRSSLMAPLAAAALLALAGIAWVAGSRVIAQHGNQNALSSHAAAPTPKSGRTATLTQVPRSFSPGASSPVKAKRSITTHPTRHSSATATRNRSTKRASTSPATPLRSVPAEPSGAARFTATPVLFHSSPALAAGVPASPLIPPAKRNASVRSHVRPVPPRSRLPRATSQPEATVAPTSGPGGIAFGPPPSPVPPPNPPRAAPIRGKPSPVATAPYATPMATPGTANTPMPSILSTPTPSPVAVVFSGRSTPTPTPTATPNP